MLSVPPPMSGHPVKYRCFEIPDRFVVGFGFDHNQLSFP